MCFYVIIKYDTTCKRREWEENTGDIFSRSFVDLKERKEIGEWLEEVGPEGIL